MLEERSEKKNNNNNFFFSRNLGKFLGHARAFSSRIFRAQGYVVVGTVLIFRISLSSPDLIRGMLPSAIKFHPSLLFSITLRIENALLSRVN